MRRGYRRGQSVTWNAASPSIRTGIRFGGWLPRYGWPGRPERNSEPSHGAVPSPPRPQPTLAVPAMAVIIRTPPSPPACNLC
jgi:hypothetical protein